MIHINAGNGMPVPATAVAAVTWCKKLVITEKGTTGSSQPSSTPSQTCHVMLWLSGLGVANILITLINRLRVQFFLVHFFSGIFSLGLGLGRLGFRLGIRD